ncbi:MULTISPECIES: DUF3237 domain-containing protein [Marinomonas]|uniref:UPF0311 protein ONZ52_01905 n=1 Tax=Marinomonas rhodophyticola TaxID=2992803 RepID=A0ABT3KCK1_9GAMM|nr:DUF3237 domain-containing protein [Marinomonas sp. KJ51-3]MCW4627842.1 DUF3237 domain-containing protein [Marinomonas sp. KJ51-3]
MKSPELKFFASLEIEVDKPQEIGRSIHGERRLIPILGGKVIGENWKGEILPGGADYQLIISPRITHLDARYIIETDKGERIYIKNEAIRVASEELTQMIKEGKTVNPNDVYFRCSPKFETSAEEFQWITERMFIGIGIRKPSLVEINLFEVC